MEWWYNRVWWHIEYWEGIIESAKREIYEETWLTLDTKIVAICHASGFFWKNIMNYVTFCETTEIDVIECEEWTLHRVDIDHLESIQLFEDVKLILDIVLKDNTSTIYSIKTIFDEQWNMITCEIEN